MEGFVEEKENEGDECIQSINIGTPFSSVPLRFSPLLQSKDPSTSSSYLNFGESFELLVCAEILSLISFFLTCSSFYVGLHGS